MISNYRRLIFLSTPFVLAQLITGVMLFSWRWGWTAKSFRESIVRLHGDSTLQNILWASENFGAHLVALPLALFVVAHFILFGPMSKSVKRVLIALSSFTFLELLWSFLLPFWSSLFLRWANLLAFLVLWAMSLGLLLQALWPQKDIKSH